jgi:CRISPR/Cas system-associated exonuclease Cas4 (RecB family)
MSAPALSPAYFQKKTTDELIAARDLVEDILDFRARQFSLFEPPKPALVAPSPAASAIPEVLSPSSVSCFSDCSAKWWYRKVLELPEQRTAALALGSAVHEALAVNFSAKIQTGEDIATEGIAMVFRDSLAKQLQDAALAEDESAEDLADCGESMIRVYMREAAPSIQPAAVELPVEGSIGGVAVRGIVDILTADGDVIDIKTAARKPSGVSAAHRLQVSTYAMLLEGASGRGRIDTLTKGKTTALHTNSVHVGEPDRKLTERLYSITLDQMRSGLVAPNRASFLCSKKHCSLWRTCQSDFGGEVE